MHKYTFICMLEQQHIHKHINIQKYSNLGTHALKQNTSISHLFENLKY